MEPMIGMGMAGIGVPQWMLAALPVLAVWSLFWKGLALWHSARRAQSWWFVIMLVVNTLGILEIIYLFAVAKLKLNQLFTFGTTHTPSQAPDAPPPAQSQM